MTRFAASITRHLGRFAVATALLVAPHAHAGLVDDNEAFFVAKTGNDSNPGTRAAPFLTIQRGINAAAGSSKKRVLVGFGTYAEVVTMADGVRLHGHFEADWMTRGGFQETIIAPGGSGQAAVIANDLSTGGTLDGLTINAPNGLGVGASSIGVLINNSPGFRVHFVGINPGTPVAGANAAPNAAAPGAPGGAGGGGTNGTSTSAPAAGGPAGTSSCGRPGGAGGAGGYDNANGSAGTGGTVGTAAGNGGAASNQCFVKSGTGQTGSNGTNGATGSGGPAAGLATPMSFGLLAATAGMGTNGTHGNGGGGGGGGGGGSSNNFCVADRGGGGGGGGGGGCGGTGGLGGMTGGSSIGIYSFNSANVEISNIFVTRGNGANGGSGQPGSQGGVGGNPGAAGSGADDAGNGGPGGRGGNGGNGGGGGGGRGGSTYAVLAAGTGGVHHVNIQYTGGFAGAGGAGGAPNGVAGSTGSNIVLSGPMTEITALHIIDPSVSGTGTGMMISDIGYLRCSSASCLPAVYPLNTMVELTARPGPGSVFQGWSGACTGTAPCVRGTVQGAFSINAEFRAMASVAATRMDFNANRVSDVLYRNVGTGQVYRLLMNGFSTPSGRVAHTEPDLTWSVSQSGDFNGDGVTDLVWRKSDTGAVFVQPFDTEGISNGGGVIHIEPNPDWRIVHTPDINGDGRADLLWWNVSTGQAYGMLLNGASVIGQGVIHNEPDTNWKIVAVGDFTGSGKSNQLVWRHFGNGAVYLMTVEFAGGAFTQTGQVIYQEANMAWQIVGAADFDADGRSDLVWRNTSTGVVYLMLMEGPVAVEQNGVYTEINNDWKIVALGDYDGDAKADLLWRNEVSGQVYLVRMDGLTKLGQGMVYTEPDTQWRVLGPRAFAAAGGVPQP